MRRWPGKSMLQIQHKIHFNVRNRYAKTVWNKPKSSWRCCSTCSCIITNVPYIQYEQFQLDNNLKTYLKGTLQSEHILMTGIKPIPYQKSYKRAVGTQSRIIDFRDVNKQFFFLSLSLDILLNILLDNSDQHRRIYGSYNVERACKDI